MDELTLKRRLFDELGGFSDKRIKDLHKSDLFICDDREHAARDARKQLFLWYCTVVLRVISGDTVHIELGQAMPMSDAVDAWWKANTIKGRYGLRVIEINKGEEVKLGELAKRIAAIVKKPYSVKAYKYVCPEVAGVLQRTQKILSKVWAD
ncbi:hypothetical protein [Bradyrhizobium sp. LB11.1]|uniref:hypothetical protein n=1 Tax=Bradyrhizobium sp. LB11.1 TaxID=3156326 RepID=UPI003397B5CB